MSVPGQTAAVVRRVLPAPPDAVYREWLDPDGMAEWMCPLPARATKVELDPRIGGRLRIDVDDRGLQVAITGTYVDLARPHRLKFTWHSSAWAATDRDSLVTVTLEPHGTGETLITIHHTLLPHLYTGDYEQGWDKTASQLADVLRNRQAQR